MLLAARPEARGIASRVATQVADDQTQTLDHHVEGSAQMSQVRLFAERRHKARQVIGARNVGFRFDADEQPQRRIALEFFEAGVERDMPQREIAKSKAPQSTSTG